MRPTSADIKIQLRMDPTFTVHDAYFESLIQAAIKSIERDYHCQLVETEPRSEEGHGIDTEEAQAERQEKRKHILLDEDIALAIKFLVNDAYLNNFQGEWLDTRAVRALLFPLMEHTV